MCGICGIVNYSRNNKVEEALVNNMSRQMAHRGPDETGVYVNNSARPAAGLGHRRLKIIDLTASARQPMPNEERDIWVVFNGEIYNFAQLRQELEAKGHKFRSHSDTEVLVHLYEEEGEDCVRQLRGMFAFAIWDERKQSLFLARDRLGKKPLIYSYRDSKFCFASEFTALLASGMASKEIDLDALNYYLTFGYIPAPRTIYNDVFKLAPAHTLTLKNAEVLIKRYWELDYSTKIKISQEEAADEVYRLLKEAVKLRLYSDVPLGAFLSGGIDSSAVVALMSELSPNRVKTFSIGFQESDYNELHFARNVASRFNTQHQEFIVRPQAMEILPLLVERFGEPYADSSCIPTYYVAQQTRQYVTVALNGDGGDELFAGYERYQAMLLAERIPGLAKPMLGAFAKILPDSPRSKNNLRRIKRFLCGAALPLEQRYMKWIGIFDPLMKKNLYAREFSRMINQAAPMSLMAQFLQNDGGLSRLDSLLRTDTLTYLPYDLLVKVDITSMANSLEARSPFLDHHLVEFAAKLPAEYKMKNFVKKYILKKAIKGRLPDENIHRRKMGFGVPVGEWLRNDLKGFLTQTLLSDTFFKRGYFQPDTVKDLVNKHLRRQADFTFQIWALLMLELWHRRFID